MVRLATSWIFSNSFFKTVLTTVVRTVFSCSVNARMNQMAPIDVTKPNNIYASTSIPPPNNGLETPLLKNKCDFLTVYQSFMFLLLKKSTQKLLFS